MRKNKEKRKKGRLDTWKDKALNGQFLRETKELKEERRWQWLKAGVLKRQAKSLICAAQKQALRRNSIKYAIDKLDVSPYADYAKRKLIE